MRAMPSPPRVSNNGLRRNSRDSTWELTISMSMRARMARMWMQMRRKKHRKPKMNQCRMWRTEGIVGLAREPVMSTGMSLRMATMQIQMKRQNHCKPMMDQCRMWRTQDIVLESVKIGQYISDM